LGVDSYSRAVTNYLGSIVRSRTCCVNRKAATGSHGSRVERCHLHQIGNLHNQVMIVLREERKIRVAVVRRKSIQPPTCGMRRRGYASQPGDRGAGAPLRLLVKLRRKSQIWRTGWRAAPRAALLFGSATPTLSQRRQAVARPDAWCTSLPRRHSKSHPSEQIPRTRGDVGSLFRVRMSFSTCFAISARTSRDSPARIEC
jgi:hypothetical protein